MYEIYSLYYMQENRNLSACYRTAHLLLVGYCQVSAHGCIHPAWMGRGGASKSSGAPVVMTGAAGVPRLQG